MQDRRHAIVMGGSMAGLLAARVLSDHFQEVTLIERDRLPGDVQQRRGVPQGRHTHGLLASGREVLERFFPGICSTLVDRGALSNDIARQTRWFFEGACLDRPRSALTGILATRPLLEAVVRERVLAIPNVRRRDNTAVGSLLVEDGEVRGVRASGTEINADLVIDAMGRGSRTPQWLESLGYEKPREEAVQVGIGYATRLFRRRPADLNGDTGAVIPPTPGGKRGGVILAQEGDRWTVTLIAHFGNYPPEELDGFIEFSRTLPAPYIYQVIRNAEPLDNGASTRFPASIRHRYESLKRFPAGYLVIGDAMCSFNPIYGQGMSVAALEAVELDKTLSDDPDNLARVFFRRAAKVLDTPWSIAVGNDLRIPETVGPRTRAVRFINWYISKLHRAAHTDARAALAFHQVGNLLAPPPVLLRPQMALRVLWRNMRRSEPAARDSKAQAAAAR